MDHLRIPELLLHFPVAPVNERHVRDGRLTLSVEEAAAAVDAYTKLTASYMQRESHLTLDADIIPAVDFALRLFNAENFTGELVPAERERYASVLERFTMPDDLRERYVQRLLASDGELPHPCVRLSALLLAVIALATRDSFLPPSSVWRLRVHMRHQLVLQHRAHSIFAQLLACVDAALALPDAELTAAHLLEIGHVQNYYHRRDLAAETFWRAARKSGLSIDEKAMFGVRTRWQQHQVVQMIVDAHSARPIPLPATPHDAPRAVMGESDGHDLLDRPRETPESAPLPLQPLHPEDKAIILALSRDIRNKNPFHGLTQHHIQTYVERVLADTAPAPFVVQAQALLLRARLEKRRNRVQERAFMQMTELIDQFSARRDPSRETFERTSSDFFYTVTYPTIWKLKSEYADFCFDENLFKTALDIYEQVLDWENIIKCCKSLDKRKRAESLARDLLETDPHNPMLWVALGEATREDAHLWKAWELSNHRSAAPMRALAKLALEREHYSKVIEYFDEAVRLNPVFGGDWFSLGYAAMRLENWKRSGEAFTRVCQIQPNDAFAWNNLSSVLLREGKLRPAFNAMSQALRNNRRDWRMWQNYFSIGCELKEVTETTNALNVALEIAQRNIRLERSSLHRFVANAIEYMEGKIPASSRDTDADAINHISVGESCMDDDDMKDKDIFNTNNNTTNNNNDAEDDNDEEGMKELVPFCNDMEMPETFLKSESNTVESPEAAKIRESVLLRYRQRIRETFQRITDLFVTDPEIYACGAMLYRYMDGPLAAFEFRLKELRCCQQKDQWERDEKLFPRTCECLHSMAEDAFAALDVSQEADAAAGAECGGDEEAAQQRRHVQDRVVSALKGTLNHLQAVLEATEEYVGSTKEYDNLRTLTGRVKKRLQEAKAAFILN